MKNYKTFKDLEFSPLRNLSEEAERIFGDYREAYIEFDNGRGIWVSCEHIEDAILKYNIGQSRENGNYDKAVRKIIGVNEENFLLEKNFTAEEVTEVMRQVQDLTGEPIDEEL